MALASDLKNRLSETETLTYTTEKALNIHNCIHLKSRINKAATTSSFIAINPKNKNDLSYTAIFRGSRMDNQIFRYYETSAYKIVKQEEENLVERTSHKTNLALDIFLS